MNKENDQQSLWEYLLEIGYKAFRKYGKEQRYIEVNKDYSTFSSMSPGMLGIYFIKDKSVFIYGLSLYPYPPYFIRPNIKKPKLVEATNFETKEKVMITIPFDDLSNKSKEDFKELYSLSIMEEEEFNFYFPENCFTYLETKTL